MLAFACIRDCSVCPFFCNREFTQRKPTRKITNSLPEGLTQTESEIIKDLPEIDTKSEKIEQKSLENEEIKPIFAENVQILGENSEKVENFANLPVISEIQYEVKDVKKKGILDRFRRKK